MSEKKYEMKEFAENVARLTKIDASLERDTSLFGSNYRNLVSQYDKLNQINSQLLDKIGAMSSLSEKNNAKLSADLQLTQEQLMRKQDELKALEAQLNKQKSDLDSLNIQLQLREKRVNELEDILKRKDQAATDLKAKLSAALYNFENKGLTITQKNGKVYVSMDESLLFASGKTAVEPKGIEALKNVANVLAQSSDINVMVEGHTDNVPMAGKGDIKDNWDLSVMRATSVTKIMLTAAPNIAANRITAAGRGEFFPIDATNTADARKKNRRTEIILTPKLDELLKVLEGN